MSDQTPQARSASPFGPGCLVVFLLFAGVCVLANYESPEESRARQANREARNEASERARVAEVQRMQDECTESLAASAERVVSKYDGDRLFVVPRAWDALTIDQRRGLAMWYSSCQRNGAFIHIKNGNTGRRLATFSLETGYSGAE